MMDFEIVIVGAGAIGLSVAKSLSDISDNICIIEKNTQFGQETSSRNSEVVHSGIYYPENSLKSKLCIEGSALLYDYCLTKNIKHEKCGKLIIANGVEQVDYLNVLKRKATSLKLDSSFLCKEELSDFEPLVNADSAIYLKNTGIIDSHSFMSELYNEIVINRTNIVFKTKVVNVKKISNGYLIKIKNPDSTFSKFSTKILINCSGLYSSQIASSLEPFRLKKIDNHFWKGSYFQINNKLASSIKRLIYPVPDKEMHSLGIHTTKSLDGRVKLGPDSEYIGSLANFDYSVKDQKRKSFYKSGKKYLPFLELEDLSPDFSGIRPKLQGPNDQVKDFYIKNEESRDLPNFINLLGIESPGLTSALAIGNYVRGLIKI
ncbi:NAD(P)/FAD-dependent oxidoreductase [Candidatus Marinimicrobia bacterium]|nr:NAD(P)/FAD-dependent oxidoreductase [Candidatus Neomarinimicrobiota bacterium]